LYPCFDIFNQLLILLVPLLLELQFLELEVVGLSPLQPELLLLFIFNFFFLKIVHPGHKLLCFLLYFVSFQVALPEHDLFIAAVLIRVQVGREDHPPDEIVLLMEVETDVFVA
jgi:hypothetical protein